MRNIIRGGLIALALTAAASPALACDNEPYIGTVCTTAASYCPEQYLPADGQLLQIKQNEALFSVIGTRYGGDGRTTFALPDLRNTQGQPSLTTCIAVRGLYPQRRD